MQVITFCFGLLFASIAGICWCLLGCLLMAVDGIGHLLVKVFSTIGENQLPTLGQKIYNLE